MQTELTATEQKPSHLFQPGQSGNPLGRPRGSRNKLSEDFLKALADDFAEHGVEAIQAVRTQSPKDYMKVIASLLPRGVELDIEVGPSPELKAELEQFMQDYRAVKAAMARIGVSPLMIEAVADD